MATIKVKSIGNQFVLNNKDYEYLLQHMNEELQILSMNYTRNGHLWSFAVHARSADCITVFVDENQVEYEVNYNANNNN